MTDRDRLIELLKVCLNDENIETDDGYVGFGVRHESIADYLLSNGVIVLPCYIGQEVWYLSEHFNGSVEIEKGKISMLQQKADKSWKFRFSHNSSVWDFKIDDIGVRYFLTKEEAEKVLKELQNNA